MQLRERDSERSLSRSENYGDGGNKTDSAPIMGLKKSSRCTTGNFYSRKILVKFNVWF